MTKRVYISADYAESDGDREVADALNRWGADNKHMVDFVDMAKVASGSVSKNPDCRACDLKREFNNQINASSTAIFIIGNNTAKRLAGSGCERVYKPYYMCGCTPYKHNSGGAQPCKAYSTVIYESYGDVSPINCYSYLRHEFEQARKKGKTIIVLYNSLRKEESWLPPYMNAYKDKAQPFWTRNIWGVKVGNYLFIKNALGYV